MNHFSKFHRLTAALLIVVLLISAMPAAFAESFSAYVKSGSMPVYSNATLSKKVGTLDPFTVVTVKSYSGGVAKISYGGKTVYAKTSAMEPVEAVAEKAVVNTSTLVFAKPDTSSASVDLPKNTEVNIIAVNGKWALIEMNGVGGYTNIGHLTKTAAATPAPTAEPQATKAPDRSGAVPAKVTASKVTVYKSASTSSKALGTLKKGAQMNVLATQNGWAYVERNGSYGFCKAAALTPVDAAVTAAPTATAAPAATPDLSKAIPAKVTASSMTVYKSASTSSKSLGTLGKGAKVNVVKIEGSWAYVERNGSYGFCKASALTPVDAAVTATPAPTATPALTATPDTSDAIPAKVTASSMKVYKTASTSSKSLGTLKKGAQVNVIKIKGSWAYVERNGAFGFCKVSALTPVSQLATATPEPTATPDLSKAIPAKVTASSVTVYKTASTSAKSLGTLGKGAKINVVRIEGSWAYVERNGAFGFCKVSALTPVSELTATPTPAAKLKAVINTTTKVYKKASTSSGSATVKQGTKVDLLGVNGDWAYIRSTSGVYAYIPLKYLSTTESEYFDIYLLDKPVAAVVTSEQAGVRSEPGFWGEGLGTLKKGTQVQIIAMIKDGSYVKIDWNGKQGWCSVDCLGPVEKEDEKDPLQGFTKDTFGATVVTHDAKYYDVAGEGDGVSIPFGTDVTVGAYNEKWAFVTVNDRYGFVEIGHLSRKSYTALSKGSTGSEVSTLEKALLGGGYFDGQPDTTYDSATETAVKRFQTACGVAANGEASESLQRMLYSSNAPTSPMLSTTLSKGDKGDSVTRLQTRLFALGYLSKSTSIDGDFGTTTAAAVSLFQNCNEVSTSSKADANTLRKLYSTSAVTLPSGKLPSDQGGTVVQPQSGNQKNNSTTISSTLASTTSKYSESMSGAEKLEYVIYVGQNQLGKPYVYGANGTSSYDCTGFTCYCFKQIGIKLPRTAVSQGTSNTYPKINSISELKRGDLVYLNTVNDSDLSDHAGIYLGAGWFMHASSGQGRVVISTLTSGYYNRVFSWGRRVFD